MSYAPYIPMIEAARPKSALWRVVLGTVTAIVLTFAWIGLTVAAVALAQGSGLRAAMMLMFGGPADTPARTVLYLVLVGGLAFATLAAAALWHGRTRASLMGRGPRVLRDFAIAAAITLVIASLLSLSQVFVEGEGGLVRNLDLATWLFWLPFALLALAMQTGAEELFFRGYLQSQMAARFRSPILWLGLPAILFGFAHFAPVLPGGNAWLYVGFAALFGLLAGDLTARTGSIGAAWGWHLANNTLAVLVIATEGSVTGLGFWRTTDSLLEPIELSPFMIFDVLILLAVWYAIRRATAR